MGKIVIHNAISMRDYLGKDISAHVKGLLPRQRCILPGKWVALKTGDVWYIEIAGDDDWHGSMLDRLEKLHGTPSEFVITGLIDLRDNKLTIRCEKALTDMPVLKRAIQNNLALVATGWKGRCYEETY